MLRKGMVSSFLSIVASTAYFTTLSRCDFRLMFRFKYHLLLMLASPFLFL